MPILTNSTTSQLNHHQRIQEWESWAAMGEPGAGEQRELALETLKQCIFEELADLNLENLSLKELPATLPPHIKTFSCFNNQLTHLPENLPDNLEVLVASRNRLIVLPHNLPQELRTLDVRINELTHLPENLPNSLYTLNVEGNQLFNLPDTLPIQLEALDVGFNLLTSLPDTLPPSLKFLRAHNNRLNSFPTTLPPFLMTLNVNNNLLTSLPDTLPPSLIYVHAFSNPITHVPATIHPSISLSLSSRNSVLVQPDSNLQLVHAVELWDKNVNRSQWQQIQSEEDAPVFASFLHKLNQGLNVHNSRLREYVAHWLTHLVKDENSELRQQTFKLAQQADASCVDRASFYFNKMVFLMLENEVIKTDQSQTIEELIGLSLSAFRLGVLEKISAKHVQKRLQDSPSFSEDIEIYLAYQYKLRDEFNLPIYTELQYDAVANITDEDLLNAKTEMLDQEKKYFLRYLVTESLIWQAKINAWNAEKERVMKENYLEEIASPQFEKAIDDVLLLKGIPADDHDARHLIRTRLEADRLYSEKLVLSKTFLEEKGALALIAPFLNPMT